MAANQPERQSSAERKQKGACFACGKPGHWAVDCPSNDKTKKASSPPPPPVDTHHLPVLRCHCGVACTVCVAHSVANDGRRYYSRNCKCGNVTQGRSFYKWCDDVKAPMCECGAGACTVNIRRDENGKETKYYTCRIRTGHGACGFLLVDTPPSPLNSLPRSAKKDKGPPTLSLHHCGLPNIKTCRISAAGNGYAEANEVPQNALGNDTKPLGVPMGTSNIETAFTPMKEEGVTNTILKEVGRNLQIDQLTHLESTESPDHNTMLPAVNDTFDASVDPLIECGPFVQRLVESIQGISIVARTEPTLHNGNHDVHSIPKNIGKCLNDISGINAEAFAAVTDTGSYHLQSVNEAASRIKDALCQIEKLETYLLKTAMDVGQSKRCIQATYQELTKFLETSTGETRARAFQLGQH
ncbi:hypothetical protein HRI_002230900 [Hibiscus trionum]|uniref:CCHC-type domain-containing protein n=1 Tax=Hibiscus trionum TaxID=183268 RepID=A0A9W7HZ05_HIBTR|nr:hypothetical protein HRI_002230900 [Hibiscus trionum]